MPLKGLIRSPTHDPASPVQRSVKEATKAVAEQLGHEFWIYGGNADEETGTCNKYLVFTLDHIKWNLYLKKTFQS